MTTNNYGGGKGFVHLHNHTEYSLLDGVLRVNDLINQARQFDMPAVAMTDHGVLYGMIDFYRTAKKKGVKPLLGCEVYVTPGSRLEKNNQERYHLVLLAENNRGYQNLIKIVSQAWLEGFYYKPRVDKDLLYQYRKGLIALSACVQGEVSAKILRSDFAGAVKAANQYQQIFGKENFFLEIQNHHLAEEKKVSSNLIKIGSEYELPLVITNDVHYLKREDAELHDMMLALQTGKTINDQERMTFPNQEFYFKNSEEMRALFPRLTAAADNTIKIAERCEVNLDFSSFYLPDYPGGEEGREPAVLLREKCEQGLVEHGLADDHQARERLNYELNIIEKMGYVSYFLIVWDFVAYARNQGIRVGPGRGSAAGSLVAYLLGITRINPLKYGLIFERFLNPARVTMPDIDIDFDDRRDEIISYVKEKYGEEKVAQIGTFGTMAARGAVRDVGRVLDLPYKRVDRIAKMIPGRPGITLEEAINANQELQQLYQQNDEVRRLLDFSRGVEGMPRHISTHAAGVIIGPEELSNIVPLQYQDENIITQLPMNNLEDMGLLKMDFLGLRNLTVIDRALQLIEKRFNQVIDIDEVPLDDSKVYQLLKSGRTLGVFQMESHLFQDLNKRLKPDRFTDIIALLALGRPGPLGSNLVDDYIQFRHGKKKPQYLDPQLEPVLQETGGLILYQEQVMQIASELGGYTLGEADLLRRGMGKKKKELIARERERFVQGAASNGIKVDTANQIFDQMEYFAGYGFNKSHSAAYALLAYQTAYLKVNYPAEFMAALLSSVMSNLDKVGLYIRECREMGIPILPPDVNQSGFEFETTAGGEIRFGLKAIKNIGRGAIEAIIEGREEGPYLSFTDFLKRVELAKLNAPTLEALIKSGAFDSFGIFRSRLLISYEELFARFNSGQRGRKKGQRSFFDLVADEDNFYQQEVEYPELDDLSIDDRLNQEKEYLGIYLSGHPLDPYRKKIARLANADSLHLEKRGRDININVAGIIVYKKEHITKRNKQMAFLTLEDLSGKIEVIVFPDLYQNLLVSIETGTKVLINGYLNDDSMIANNIFSLDWQFLEVELKAYQQKYLQKLKTFLLKHHGQVPVFLKLDNSIIVIDQRYWISRDSDLDKELEQLVGREQFTYY